MGRKGVLSNNRGQVALILIFIAAVGLILYAMSMNVSKLSAVKLLVTIAGNTSAASLVSRMASYGENVMQTQLGGRREKCDYTSILTAFISLIIVIVLVIVMVVAHQYEAAPGIGLSVTAAAIALGIAVAISVAAYVINITVIEPKITRMWNKMQANIPTAEDMFLEGTMQAGLQQMVSDEVMIRDFYDYNMDGNIAKRWGPYDTSSYLTWPTVPRFAFYYTERLKAYRDLGLMAAGDFISAAQALLTGLGLDNKGNCCQGTSINQEFCDSCCVLLESRSSTCHPDLDDPALWPPVPPLCESGPFPGYPLSYDRLFCNRLDPTSLPGLFGMDDNNLYLRKANPFSPSSDEVSDVSGGITIYRGEDSSGKLFPLLWMARDGVSYIRNLDTTLVAPNPSAITATSKNCHWCAPGSVGATPPVCDSATDKSSYRFWYYPVTRTPYGQLTLSRPCSGDTCCTHRFNADPYYTAFTADTRTIDEVGMFATTINGVPYANGLFEAHPPFPPDDCPGTDGFWRIGGDDFCSTTAPYYMGTTSSNLCLKYTGMAACLNPVSGGAANQCDCSAAVAPNQRYWFDDQFDDFIHWMKGVASEIDGVLNPNGQPATARIISDTFETWRAGAEEIINSIDGCTCTCNGSGDCVSPVCTGTGIYDRLAGWEAVFQSWLNDTYTDEGPGPLWCLPNNFNFLPTNEYSYVVNGGVAYGSIRSILNCLEYNSNIIPKLESCKAFCDANPGGTGGVACQNLPRSLLLPPGVRNNPATDLNAIYNQAGSLGCAQIQNVTINGAPVNLPFSDIITMTLRLAYDQAEKMKKRHEYLVNMYDYVRNMADGINRLKAYMAPGAGGLVQNVKDAICYLAISKSKGKIENVAYYGWCTDWATGDYTCQSSGKWHVIRAEAWLPRRCDGFQGGAGCCTNEFPWVKTEKRGSFKRCYFMQAHSGRVRVRVLRYDSPTGSSGKVINFANGFPLWQFRESSPYIPSTSLPDLYWCQSTDNSLYNTIAPGAFMLNGTSHLGQKNARCQNAIVAAMNQAVGNETCAFYYLDGNTYRMRFGRCDNSCAAEGIDPNSK